MTSDTLMGEPGADGRFGRFGGRFVPEALVPACQDLEREFRAAWSNPAFKSRATTTCSVTTPAGPAL